jgi:hypothetical protein
MRRSIRPFGQASSFRIPFEEDNFVLSRGSSTNSLHLLTKAGVDEDDTWAGVVDDFTELRWRETPIEWCKGASDLARTKPRVKETVTIRAEVTYVTARFYSRRKHAICNLVGSLIEQTVTDGSGVAD